MKKHQYLSILFLTLVTLLPFQVQAKKYQYETVEGDMMKTRIYTLDNGLRVYLSVNPEKPRIQTYIAVRTGSKNDPAETTGRAPSSLVRTTLLLRLLCWMRLSSAMRLIVS